MVRGRLTALHLTWDIFFSPHSSQQAYKLFPSEHRRGCDEVMPSQFPFLNYPWQFTHASSDHPVSSGHRNGMEVKILQHQLGVNLQSLVFLVLLCCFSNSLSHSTSLISMYLQFSFLYRSRGPMLAYRERVENINVFAM